MMKIQQLVVRGEGQRLGQEVFDGVVRDTSTEIKKALQVMMSVWDL